MNEELEMQEGPEMEPEVQESDLPTEPANLSESDQAYLNALIKLMHSKKTAPRVEEMLESGHPKEAVPATALMINNMMEQEAKKGGKPPSLELLFQAGMVIVGDLVEIGNAKGIFEIYDEGEMQALLQTTMQRYIEKGLKEGTIDPVELQQKAESLMDPADREAGLAMAQKSGTSMEPNEHTAMEVYAQREMKKQGMLKGGAA